VFPLTGGSAVTGSTGSATSAPASGTSAPGGGSSNTVTSGGTSSGGSATSAPSSGGVTESHQCSGCGEYISGLIKLMTFFGKRKFLSYFMLCEPAYMKTIENVTFLGNYFVT
jgi:hypothetical protein